MASITPELLQRIKRMQKDKIERERELKSHIAKTLEIPYQNVTMTMVYCLPYITNDEMKAIYQIASSQNLPFEDVYGVIKAKPETV